MINQEELRLRRELVIAVRKAEESANQFVRISKKNLGQSKLRESLLNDLKYYPEDTILMGDILDRFHAQLDHDKLLSRASSQLKCDLIYTISLAITLVQRGLGNNTGTAAPSLASPFIKISAIIKDLDTKFYVPEIIFPLTQLLSKCLEKGAGFLILARKVSDLLTLVR